MSAVLSTSEQAARSTSNASHIIGKLTYTTKQWLRQLRGSYSDPTRYEEWAPSEKDRAIESVLTDLGEQRDYVANALASLSDNEAAMLLDCLTSNNTQLAGKIVFDLIRREHEDMMNTVVDHV